jgi:hypothetical protein
MARQVEITDLPDWITKDVPPRVACQANHTGRVKPLARYRITQTSTGADAEPWFACLPCTRKAILHRERHDERLNLVAERAAGWAEMDKALVTFREATGVTLVATAQNVPDGASGRRLVTMSPAQVVALAQLLVQAVAESTGDPHWVTPYTLVPDGQEQRSPDNVVLFRGRTAP